MKDLGQKQSEGQSAGSFLGVGLNQVKKECSARNLFEVGLSQVKTERPTRNPLEVYSKSSLDIMLR
jgi:hypothetical protein